MGNQQRFVQTSLQSKLSALNAVNAAGKSAFTLCAHACATAWAVCAKDVAVCATAWACYAKAVAGCATALTLATCLWGNLALAQDSSYEMGDKGSSIESSAQKLKVSDKAAKAFDKGIKLSLMMLPSRYADALVWLNEAQKLEHPYASVAILFTNALANRQNYEYEKYADQITKLLDSDDPQGITLAVFTTIEATDYLKHHDAKLLLNALNKALAKSYVPAWYVKGLTLIKIGYAQVGFDDIKQAADSGYAVAQYHLAFLILSGKLSMDKMYAFNLLQSALKAGHLGAYRELGYCFEHGVGTRIDSAQALELYHKGFSYGDISAAASYGLLMLKQDQPEYIESFNALSFAYNNGVKEVANALGTLYIKGLGVMMDQEHGFKLIKLAADHNDMLAMSNLISCYKNGTGTPKDLNQARLYEERLNKLLELDAQKAAKQASQAKQRTDNSK